MAFNAIGAPITSVRLETKIEGKASYAQGKSESKTQIRKIVTEISNTSDKAMDHTVMKWAIYGHDMKSEKLKVIKEGEEKTSIPANDSEVVETAEVKMSGNREYKVTSRSRGNSHGNSGGGRGKSRTKTTTVPASGEDYYGYAVEVFVGGELVASYYSKPSIEKDMHPDS